MTRLTLIAALDEDGAIGRASGGLPWHLPDETAHFRAYCRGKWLLVGRRTFDEMTGWFQPGHHVCVLSRHPAGADHTAAIPAVPIRRVATVREAVELAREAGAPELVTLGGALVFAEALPSADRLVLSRIHLRSGAEVRFPELDTRQWRLDDRGPRRDAATGIAFTVEHWHRKT